MPLTLKLAPILAWDAKQALRPRGFFLLEGVIRRSNQWTRFDVFEPHLLAKLLVFREFIRMNKTLDRQMFRGRLQILTEGKNVRALRGDLFHGGENFFATLSQTEHHSRLRRNRRR